MSTVPNSYLKLEHDFLTRGAKPLAPGSGVVGADVSIEEIPAPDTIIADVTIVEVES